MHILEWKQVCTTRRSIYYRKYILEITQPSQYRYTQLQYRFAVISEAPSICLPLSDIPITSGKTETINLMLYFHNS